MVCKTISLSDFRDHAYIGHRVNTIIKCSKDLDITVSNNGLKHLLSWRFVDACHVSLHIFGRLDASSLGKEGDHELDGNEDHVGNVEKDEPEG